MSEDRSSEKPVKFPTEFRMVEASPEAPDQFAARRSGGVPTSPALVADSVISRPLQERMAQAGDEHIGVVIELRVGFKSGTPAVGEWVANLIASIAPDRPVQSTGSYLTTALTAAEVRALVAADAQEVDNIDPGKFAGPSWSARSSATDPARASSPAPRAAINRIWPNFEIHALTIRSIIATKCQAAHRSFNATGSGIVWAVLDSGIDKGHRHWDKHGNLDDLPHRSFVSSNDDDALADAAGHGTHVAGIIAGEQASVDGEPPLLAASWYQNEQEVTEVRKLELPLVSGMAPACRLLSCKVLRDDASGDVTALLAALNYIQELNDHGRALRVHGVNISVGHPFDPSWFAAGRTPVCREVDRLVQAGVVVVVAAGNTGYGYARDPAGLPMRLGFDMTINDPGNASLAITVGSTSCSPHTSGVSYFSSKGPTGDGRMKPDIVAPGERVISAAAGKLLDQARRADGATYVENSGTSMAAPHVSGAAAAVLSVHREFVGRPDEVKRVLCLSATDLGRSVNFQGAGMLDTMRAIQAI